LKCNATVDSAKGRCYFAAAERPEGDQNAVKKPFFKGFMKIMRVGEACSPVQTRKPLGFWMYVVALLCVKNVLRVFVSVSHAIDAVGAVY